MNFERLIFVSGQGGTDPATGKIADDVEAQTEQCLKNVQAILQGRRLRSAARAALRRVPPRHEGVPAHEWRVRAHVRRSSSGTDHDPGRRPARGRIAGRDRLRRLYPVRPRRASAGASCQAVSPSEAQIGLMKRSEHRAAICAVARRWSSLLLPLVGHANEGFWPFNRIPKAAIKQAARRRALGSMDRARAAGVGALSERLRILRLARRPGAHQPSRRAGICCTR